MKTNFRALVAMLWLTAVSAFFKPGLAVAGEETFDVLQTKTGTYENVTVTSKTKDWIFILHAAGMGNIKIADLSEDIQQQLGYNLPKEKPKPLSVPSVEVLADIKVPEITQLRSDWDAGGAEAVFKAFGNPVAVGTVLGILLLVYLFFCYCSMMICRKAHTTPGILVWIPVLQMIPLLRAAGMSGVWFLAFFVPLLNLVAQIIWYVKIVKARGKGPLLVFWLLLPFTAPFAYLYLAFSEAAPIRIASNHVPLALEIS
jgi:hypothetical protein